MVQQQVVLSVQVKAEPAVPASDRAVVWRQAPLRSQAQAEPAVAASDQAAV
jgi:hypothetical protein